MRFFDKYGRSRQEWSRRLIHELSTASKAGVDIRPRIHELEALMGEDGASYD
jgi:hypothetical protein